jgi:2-oxoglutarate/2-oxoacid ferredoxin oxidoreductase subunit alpha
MSNRLAIKIAGAQGRGVDSIGSIVGKALKREGYCVFGYKEYMSLIHGGHTSYQIDVDTVPVRSSLVEVDVLVSMNYQGIARYLRPSHHGQQIIREGGYLIHDVSDWKFSDEDAKVVKDRNITVVVLPIENMLKELNAPLILQNTIFTGYLWKILGKDKRILQEMVKERYAKKEKLIPLNLACVERGYDFDPENISVSITLPDPQDDWKKNLLITGNTALSLGAIHAGVRFYSGYPMTPSSSILSYIATKQNETGMVVKQAEDEITAAQMATGAYFMGTRAMTATSGGGFDLMSETLSMIGMTETPMVLVIAQRPGPATGVPTWTTQGDLHLAVHAAHGEFPRCVIAVSDASDAFTLTAEAHNIAERYQIPVIILTDKHIAECLYCIPPYDQSKIRIDRGKLVTDQKELDALVPEDRFRITEDGISKLWHPGARAPGFNANTDEHLEEGTVTEDSVPVKNMMAKRMRKMTVLSSRLPEPELIMKGKRGKGKGEKDSLDILIVGWGSTKGVMEDVLESSEGSEGLEGLKIGYLHFTYVWPLKTELFENLAKKAKRMILFEGNYHGQLGKLLKQETGISIEEHVLKYDGRPFFYEEVVEALTAKGPLVPHRDISTVSPTVQ